MNIPVQISEIIEAERLARRSLTRAVAFSVLLNVVLAVVLILALAGFRAAAHERDRARADLARVVCDAYKMNCDR